MSYKKFLNGYLKFFLQIVGGVVFASGLVILSFSVVYGIPESFSSFYKGLSSMDRVGEVFSIETETQERSIFTSAISGTAESNYEDLDLENFQVKPLIVEMKKAKPLFVPTNGIAAHKDFLYHEESHPGIDIWTNTNGTGLNGTSKGYPVYSACSGKVVRVFTPNQEIEIQCDPLPPEYIDAVPSLNIKILYSHLGDGTTKLAYHSLGMGQRVEAGELVGYQGNISSFVPQNRVVHLHFSVYDLNVRRSLDPAPYIGLDKVRLGQTFEAGY